MEFNFVQIDDLKKKNRHHFGSHQSSTSHNDGEVVHRSFITYRFDDLDARLSLSSLKINTPCLVSQLFQNEYEMQKRIQSPNFVKFDDAKIDPIQMELSRRYLKKETYKNLYQYVLSNGIELFSIFQIAKKIASVIKEFHSKDMTLKCLRPENIFLDNNLDPYITDCGITTIFDDDVANINSPQAIFLIGPEGLDYHHSNKLGNSAKKKQPSKQLDIYNFGIILYYLISNTNQFTKSSRSSISHAISNSSLTPQSNQATPKANINSSLSNGIKPIHLNQLYMFDALSIPQLITKMKNGTLQYNRSNNKSLQELINTMLSSEPANRPDIDTVIQMIDKAEEAERNLELISKRQHLTMNFAPNQRQQTRRFRHSIATITKPNVISTQAKPTIISNIGVKTPGQIVPL